MAEPKWRNRGNKKGPFTVDSGGGAPPPVITRQPSHTKSHGASNLSSSASNRSQQQHHPYHQSSSNVGSARSSRESTAVPSSGNPLSPTELAAMLTGMSNSYSVNKPPNRPAFPGSLGASNTTSFSTAYAAAHSQAVPQSRQHGSYTPSHGSTTPLDPPPSPWQDFSSWLNNQSTSAVPNFSASPAWQPQVQPSPFAKSLEQPKQELEQLDPNMLADLAGLLEQQQAESSRSMQAPRRQSTTANRSTGQTPSGTPSSGQSLLTRRMQQHQSTSSQPSPNPNGYTNPFGIGVPSTSQPQTQLDMALQYTQSGSAAHSATSLTPTSRSVLSDSSGVLPTPPASFSSNFGYPTSRMSAPNSRSGTWNAGFVETPATTPGGSEMGTSSPRVAVSFA